MTEPVSRLDLELLALGELGPDAAAQLRARMDEDADLADRFARISMDIAAQAPLPELVLADRAEQEPSEASSKGFPRWASIGAVVAVLAAAVALFVLRPAPPEPGVTFRGSLDLEVYRIREGAAKPVGRFVEAREGDRIQYKVTPPEQGYISVFDVQDDGLVTVWNDAVEISPTQPLEAAAVLDAYPSLERVFFVFGSAPVRPEAFEQAVKAAGRPLTELEAVPGLDGMTQRSIAVLEDPP